jgi:hypothetical protein
VEAEIKLDAQLWEQFVQAARKRKRNPISLLTDYIGGGDWGTTGSPKFWAWLRACEATGGDALILEAIDAEARRYRIDLDAASVLDESAIRRRTAEVELEAREHMWKRP